jgi:hypothetical protein
MSFGIDRAVGWLNDQRRYLSDSWEWKHLKWKLINKWEFLQFVSAFD